MEKISIALNWSFYGITFLSWIHALLIVSWATSTLSNGFSNGLWHAAPIAFEVIVIKMVSMCTGLFSWSRVKETRGNVIATMVLLVFAIGFNVTHFVFSMIEIINCTTWICMADYYFLLFFTVLLATVIGTEVCLIFYLNKLRRFLGVAKESPSGTTKPNYWISGLSWVQCIILVIWATGAFVSGFVDGIFHFTPIAYEILLMKTLSETTLLYSLEIFKNKISPNLQMKRTMVVVLIVMLIVGVGFNLTHFGFLVSRIQDCTSVFCINNYGFAVFFTILIGLEAMVDLLLVIMTWFFGLELNKM